MKNPTKIGKLDQGPKGQKLNFLIQTERLFGMSVSWEVRRRLEELESEMHIYKEVRTSKNFFNNLPFSLKTGLACKAQLPRSSSLSWLFILLGTWNLEQWGLRWPKTPKWWQTMCLGLLGFLGKDLTTWFYFLNFGHWGLIWPITPQWWQVRTNLDLSKILDWNLNEGFGLRAFLSTFWFLLRSGMYTDFSFEVEHTIGTKSDTTTWLQQIFSSFFAISSATKHLACILRDSFSHFSSSTSLLDKTNLASKSTFKHSNSFSFSREF